MVPRRRSKTMLVRDVLVAVVLSQAARCGEALAPPVPQQEARAWQRATPNALTFARLAAAPVVGVALGTPGGAPRVACGAFALASVSDGVDGYLARRWRCESALGAFLDPVADKVLVSTALVMLSARLGLAVAAPAALIVAREVAVSALREWMAARGARDAVAVGASGKLKTATQMAALALLTASHGAPASPACRAGLALLRVAALLAAYSGAELALRAAGVLSSDEYCWTAEGEPAAAAAIADDR